MIQLLFEYKDIDVLTEVMIGIPPTEGVPPTYDEDGNELTPEIPPTEGIPSDFNLPIIAIPEMLDDMYFTLIKPEDVTALEDALKQPPLKMTVGGSYNMDGTQYIWTEPKEKSRNHSINKYKNNLKDVVEYDENGDEISRRRPTEAEALAIQVNKICGCDDRILEDELIPTPVN